MWAANGAEFREELWLSGQFKRRLSNYRMPAGFVWDKDGHLITSLHVVKGSSDVRVSFTRVSYYNFFHQSRYLYKALGKARSSQGSFKSNRYDSLIYGKAAGYVH